LPCGGGDTGVVSWVIGLLAFKKRQVTMVLREMSYRATAT
jgi:hypothetical protein